MRADGIERGGRVLAAGDDLEILVPFEEVLKPLQDDGMVVGEHDSDSHTPKRYTIEPVSGTPVPRARPVRLTPQHGAAPYTRWMEPLSDEELIAQYRLAPASDRSRSLIEELFRRHQTRVAAWCYRLTGDRTQAADLAQEVFVKAYANLDTFRSDSKFTTWLYVIARNRWRDELRTRAARPRELPEEAGVDEQPATENAALAALDARDARAVVRRLMDEALDETEKRVMTLHYGHGLRLDAITATLALTNASGAKAYVVSARRKLKAAVEQWNAKS
jgi:RNA polymerase sigma-70 factor, ECF subfamily